MMNTIIRTYSELISIPTFEERYRYLKLGGKIGEITFGFDRYLYEDFLKSDEWLSTTDKVIISANGCDLEMPDREIQDKPSILVNHRNNKRKDNN